MLLSVSLLRLRPFAHIAFYTYDLPAVTGTARQLPVLYFCFYFRFGSVARRAFGAATPAETHGPLTQWRLESEGVPAGGCTAGQDSGSSICSNASKSDDESFAFLLLFLLSFLPSLEEISTDLWYYVIYMYYQYRRCLMIADKGFTSSLRHKCKIKILHYFYY